MSKFPYKVLLWKASSNKWIEPYNGFWEWGDTQGLDLTAWSEAFVYLKKYGLKPVYKELGGLRDEYILIENEEDELLWSAFCLEFG